MTTFDNTFVREYHPDYQNVFSESGHDAWTMFLRRKTLMIVLLVALAALAIPAAIFGSPIRPDVVQSNSYNATSALEGLLIGAYYIAVLIISFCALADSIRTMRPDFKMTFVGVLAMIGLSIVVGIAIDVGALLFIIPAFWIAVKLSQTVYVYFLRPGRSALGESWNITTGHFWETLGFYLLLSLVVGFAMILPLYVAFFFSALYPLSGIVLIPFVFAIWSFIQYFNALVHVRWTEALLRSREMASAAQYNL
jgi:hypothetical protein